MLWNSPQFAPLPSLGELFPRADVQIILLGGSYSEPIKIASATQFLLHGRPFRCPWCLFLSWPLRFANSTKTLTPALSRRTAYRERGKAKALALVSGSAQRTDTPAPSLLDSGCA